MSRTVDRIAVVGAGAAGSLFTAALARRIAADRQGATAHEVVLIDPAPGPVRGAAFGTLDRRHLLNVPASGMSYDPDDRFDFVHWCEDQGLILNVSDTYFFAPRLEWARYLRQRLIRDTARVKERLSVRQVHARAIGFDRDGAGLIVRTDGDEDVRVDRVVLATGLPSVGEDWAPEGPVTHPRYVSDPWDSARFSAVLQGEKDVVVVGAGLTMVDVALSVLDSHPDRRVVAVSRTGVLPRAHAPEYLGEVVPDVRGWGSTTAEINAAAHAHISAVAQLQGNWRPGVDGIRYRVAELWGRLSEAERGVFLREVVRGWNVRRHRMPASSAAVIAEALASGRLEVRAMKVDAVDFGPERVTLTSGDGQSASGGWLVNCSGPRTDIRTLDNPAYDALLGATGGPAWGATDAHGLGVTTRDGQVLTPEGQPTPIWTLGALRRGELWESTAIPEIRQQAADLAAALF